MVETEQIPNFLKDVASQGALVYAVTQILKDALMRWFGDLDAQAVRGLAWILSILVALGVTPPDPAYFRWLLAVVGYGTVVLLPVALAGHVVAGLGDPRPEVVAQRRMAKLEKAADQRQARADDREARQEDVK